MDSILGVKTLSDVQVTSGYPSGIYNTLTREQTQPQADRAFSQSDQPYVVMGMIYIRFQGCHLNGLLHLYIGSLAGTEQRFESDVSKSALLFKMCFLFSVI